MTVRDWLGSQNEMGVSLWERKYRRNNESFDEWLDRISAGDDELRRLIVDRKFLFGGRALSNRGTPISEGSLFNCYSAGFAPDDTDGLLELNRQLGITYKAQGGQGVSLTKLRPKGSPVGDRFASDGIVPFMEIFNTTTSQISQGGARKGALMLSLDARHKEAETFITIKSETGKIEKANLSLEIDDEFMNAVDTYYQTGEEVVLHEKREYSGHVVEYDIIPIKLYELMIQTAYDWGEPGCLFVNQLRNRTIMERVPDYIIEGCNPCGEQPLPKHGCCNLGSLNLAEYVFDPYTSNAQFNWIGFGEDIHTAIRALDAILDENIDRHPLKEQKENSIKWRNIGLGVMGYGTMLMQMGLIYGKEKALSFTEDLFKYLFTHAVDASCELAEEKGAFPGYDPAVWDSEIMRHAYPEDGKYFRKPLRNCSLISIAPTGSISNIFGVTGGCEPEFALSYTRKTESLNGGEPQYFEVFCNAAKSYMRVNGTKELPEWFVSSSDIPWRDRIATQGVMQKYVDTAISSTVNLPKETKVEDIELLYLTAWECGLKGITIFRDGCKRLGVLTTDSPKEEPHESKPLPRGFIAPKTNDLVGKLRTLTTGCGSLHVTAFFDPFTGDFVHTFLSKGSTGGCSNFMTGLSRMISLAARGGIGLPAIVDQLDSCGTCASYAVRSATKRDTSRGSCCPMAVGNALMDMWREMRNDLGLDEDDSSGDEAAVAVQFAKPTLPAPASPASNAPTAPTQVANEALCPVCTDELVFEGGCNTCKGCGWSRCS